MDLSSSRPDRLQWHNKHTARLDKIRGPEVSKAPSFWRKNNVLFVSEQHPQHTIVKREFKKQGDIFFSFVNNLTG